MKMLWHVRLRSENETDILIEYSHSPSDRCDGLLIYNKPSKSITIEKISDGADEFGTRWLFGPLRQVLNNNDLTEKKRRICIG